MDSVILNAFADALQLAVDSLRQQAAVLHLEAYAAEMAVTEVGVLARARALHPHLGFRQEQVLEELEKAGSEGTTSGNIARSISYDQPNVFSTLQFLCSLGFAEKDASIRPHRYLLGPKLTNNE